MQFPYLLKTEVSWTRSRFDSSRSREIVPLFCAFFVKPSCVMFLMTDKRHYTRVTGVNIFWGVQASSWANICNLTLWREKTNWNYCLSFSVSMIMHQLKGTWWRKDSLLRSYSYSSSSRKAKAGEYSKRNAIFGLVPSDLLS